MQGVRKYTMKTQDNSWIPKNIFVKCLYAAHHTVARDWVFEDTETGYVNLVLITDGEGLFTCEGESAEVTKGDLAFFPQGVARTMKATGETLEFYSFNFRYRLLFEHALDWWLENPRLPLDFVTHIDDRALFRRLELLFDRILRYYTSMQYDASFYMRYYATEILYLLMSGDTKEAGYSERNMVEKSILYMSEHFTEKITLKSLADISGKSVSYYGKTFKKLYGTTPIEYLVSMRIAYAKRLLENGSSVTEAAEMCGFSDLYYFSKAFKVKEGISPSEYKYMKLNG